MSRLALRLIMLIFALAGLPAQAANFVFPGALPAGCSAAGSIYTCGSLSFSSSDTVVINAPKPATINVSGSLSTSGPINQAGSASDLNLVVTGSTSIGSGAIVKADISSSSGAVSVGSSAQVTGNITTSTGSITLGTSSVVTGNIVSSSGSVLMNSPSQLIGSINKSTGPISVGGSSSVTGSITNSGGNITVGNSTTVGGAVTNSSGSISLSANVDVTGDITNSTGSIFLGSTGVARACVRSTGSALISLSTSASVQGVCCGGSCTNSCVTNNTGSAMPPACSSVVAPASFAISGTGSASTCAPQTLTITARNGGGTTLTTYTGTMTLSTSTGRGDWSVGSSPTPGGIFTAGAANSGLATYKFVAGDLGVAKLRLSHTLAQNVVANVVDATAPASSSNSASITYRDNAFVFSEDALSKVSGADVAVAGRPHDTTLSYLRMDPSTGSCGVATDYTGNRALKFWRSDSGGSWTAPTVVSPALTIPGNQPGANNLTLTFTLGVATFNLGSSDIGRYALNVRDDSLTTAATAIIGSSNVLTVRPFAVITSLVKYGLTANPNGVAAGDAVFAPAGASFGATVAAYTWHAAMLGNGADPSNTGTPASNATEAAMKTGSLAASFASDVTLSPLAGSQTPAGGTLGTPGNGILLGTGFSAGTAATTTLQYSEVGSFALNTSGVVSNFLGSGLALDAVVVNAAGTQNTRVGRFVPAGFVASAPVLTHRLAAACSPASTFSYLDENFQLAFTLTAQNALGARTNNYTGSFARLDLAVPAKLGLAGIGGSTPFIEGGRLTVASSSGTWSNGQAVGVLIQAMARRAAAADGPFATAQFGIAALDDDSVGMLSFNLDTSSPANGADRSLLATVPLRFGRLRLHNAIGSQTRALRLPLQAQYWDGSAFVTNTSDSCSPISAANLSFGNFRKTLAASDAVMTGSPIKLNQGLATLTLAAPAVGRSGSYDLALSLGATPTDASCLQTWTPGKPATTAAAMAYLRGAWCGTDIGKDPAARASFGLYRGNDATVYQRENY